MNKQQLASKIWESANKMRSKIEANEYKDYILGFMFYKFLSDKEIAYLKKEGITDSEMVELLNENEKEAVQLCQNNLGYFIAYENLFSTWISKGKDFNIKNVRDSLSAFNRLISEKPTHKKVFTNIFRTLDTGLSKLGENSGSQTKAVSDLLNLIKDIPMDGKQDYDVLGFIYEYLISMFAANAGKKAGEFYTPHEVSVLMAEIVANHIKNNNQENFEIYDPTSGSGSLLITIGKALSKHIDKKDNIKYYAQELIESTYNLTRMNLVMRGINPLNIVTRNGDTLEDDWPDFDENDKAGTYEPLFVDAVVSNPPYSQTWDSTNKAIQPRYEYGLAPTSKADYAFLLHDLYHIKPNGIMTIVLPHGVLFRGKAGKNGEKGEAEYEIRKNLIENNHIEAIIGLPANIFFGTGIPTIIIVLKKERNDNGVLIIDASKNFAKVGKQNKLQASDIKRIVDTVIERKDVHKFSRLVSKEEIRNNDYNLNIPRYVDSSEDSENFDIYASVVGGIPNNEIEKFEAEWKAFPSLQNELFKKANDSYFELNCHAEEIPKQVRNDNQSDSEKCHAEFDSASYIKEKVLLNKDVKGFEENYIKEFADFKNFLKTELITKLDSINENKEEDVISEKIFEKLDKFSLVDKYKAFQNLDDEWQKVAVDLEIIKTEGFNACKEIEPLMVVKGKDEVQDGWKGRILPFELVQKNFLKDELNALNEKENALEKNNSELSDLIPETEDDDSEVEPVETSLTDEQKKQEKKLKDEAKTLRKEISNLKKNLEEKTCEKIKNLSDNEVKNLLEKKWITPLVEALNGMPKSVISDFISSISKMTEKYSETLTTLNNKINATQTELFSLMDELKGNEFDLKGLEELKKILGE